MQEASAVVTALQLGVKALQFYNADHPRVVEAMAQLEQACGAMLAQRGRVSLTAVKGSLLVDGEPLEASTVHVRTLAAELERRQIGGVIIMAGVRRGELLELARLLTMRPEQLRTAGGAEEILERAEVEHVRISHVRYEAVTEGEEVVWSKSVRRADAASDAAVEALPALLQQFLLQKIGGDQAPSGEATLLTALKADARGESPRAEEILRQAMEGMDPVAKLALLVSMDRLPVGEVRDSFRAAAMEPTQALLQALVNSDDQLSLLRERLADMGVSREQLDELLDVMVWEKLTFDERVAKLLAGSRIFDFPQDKLVRFLRELLDAQRSTEVQKLLTHYVTGLGHDTLFVRRTVCGALGEVALFIKEPGVPREIEQLVGTSILNHFVQEGDARMRMSLGAAAANFIAMLMATNRCEPALRVIGRLDAAVAAAPEGATVRLAEAALTESFGEAHRATELIAQSMSADPDTLARFVMPLVTRLGGAATPHFIDALGTEEDRNRRGRLVKALKAIGEPAFPFLIEALRSPSWFVIRNALNVLGDIGRAEHVEAIGKKLDHGDARVRRAAARTLSKIGGFDAEVLLVGAMNDRDDETQAEVMLCLASMKAQTAIPGLAELARGRLMGTDEKVRELAINTLAQIGTDAAVGVLADIVRSKSLFGRITPPVRAAAARALATIKTPAAREALREAGIS